MKTIHVRNLEKYNPGYKDRHLIWFRCFFSVLDGDPEFEMICEIDKWRYIALIILELKNKKPTPYNDAYLFRKGFVTEDRPIRNTISELESANLVQVVESDNVTEDQEERNKSVTQIRIDKNRIEQNRIEEEGSAPAFAAAKEDPQDVAIRYIDKYRERLKITCDQKGYKWGWVCFSLAKLVDWMQVTEDMSDYERGKRFDPVQDIVTRWLFRDADRLRSAITPQEDEKFRNELTRICNRKPKMVGLTAAQEAEHEASKRRTGGQTKPVAISAILSRAMKGDGE